MNTWILVILMFGDGRSAHHIEFDSMASCHYAQQKVGEHWTMRTVCVPKRLP